MSTRNKIIAHCTFWIVSSVTSIVIWSLPKYENGHFWSFLLGISPGYISGILYFYINYFILVPFFLDKRRYLTFGLLTLLNTQLHIVICSLLWFQTYEWAFTYSKRLGPMTYESLYLFIISTGFRMFELWNKSEERKNELERELKEAEMLFLQSQMSPHFLFNTLNNIYGLSLNNSPYTAKSIGELKNLMHYFEQFENGEQIELIKELDHLKAFIELNRLRNPVNVMLRIEIPETQKNIFIEPMLLLPFIENAFKHGDLNKEIHISLSVEKNRLFLKVMNQQNKEKRKDRTGGIGIVNVRRRLELLYPKKHQLEISNVEGQYVSQMMIEVA